MTYRLARWTIAVLGVALTASLLTPSSAEAGRWRKKKSSGAGPASAATSINGNYYYTAPIWATPGSMRPKKK